MPPLISEVWRPVAFLSSPLALVYLNIPLHYLGKHLKRQSESRALQHALN